jgi:hypothetical protein
MSDEGNQSDPGAGGATVTLKARQWRREREAAEEARRRRKSIVDKSVRETRMVRNAGLDSVVRYVFLQRGPECEC